MKTTATIDSDGFRFWLNDPITKEVFKALNDIRKNINIELINSNLIMKDQSGKKLAHLVGQRDGLDMILQIEFEDVQKMEDEIDE